MNRTFRSISLALLAAFIVAAGANMSYAQAGCDDMDAINALDAKIRENYPKAATREVAINAAKEYLEKFGACEATKEFSDWLKVQLPNWEKSNAEYKKRMKMTALFKRFDDGIEAAKYEDVYASGREILAEEPENVHVMIPLGIFGLNESYKKNYKYNDDTVRYAKLAIEKLKAGAPPKMRDGKPILNKEGQPAYSTWDFSKQEAIDELTYSIAYIDFYTKNDRKSALPLYYQLTQSSGRFKNEPRVYAAIGDFYMAEKNRIGTEIQALLEKQKAATTDEEKEKLEVEIKGKVGLFNGYAERALDAFGRAHKVAPTASANDTTYKNELMKIIQDLYKQRFDKDAAMAGMNAYLANAIAKPFPNPTSEVAPINDPDPATTTTTTGVGAADGKGAGAANGTGAGAANGSGIGNAANARRP